MFQSKNLQIIQNTLSFLFFFLENVVEPIRGKNKLYYYHRQFRRVPTIDECDVGDELCVFEANEQYKRDR